MPFSFLHPMLFAIGAACVSIPIIIHLLKRRRRVIPWGAMRFLEEAYRKRRRIITLEQLILLALRCVLVLLIAMGVGSLVLGGMGHSRLPKTLVIVLDDSIASARIANASAIIDQHIDHAITRVDGLDPSQGDRVVLISAAAPAQAIVLPASDDLGAVRALIEQSTPTDASFDLEGAMALIEQIESDPSRPSETELFIASDARGLDHAIERVGTDLSRVQADTIVLPESDPTPAMNVGIVSATPTRSLIVRDGLALPESVRIELVRSGEVDASVETQIEIVDPSGTTRGASTVTWRTGERASTINIALDTRELNPTAAKSAILIARLSADANPRDNQALIALPTRNTLRVAIVDRPRGASGSTQGDIPPSRWVRAALAPRADMGVQITSIDASQATARLAPGVDAVFVLAPAELNDAAWDRIARLRDQGVMIVVTPDARSESLAWFDRVHGLAPDSFSQVQTLVTHDTPMTFGPLVPPQSVLAGIESDWDALAGAAQLERSMKIDASATPIALLADASPLGVQIIERDGSGVLVVLCVPFDLTWSNLPARPLFVAMMQELVRQGVGVGETRLPVLAGTPMRVPDWSQSMRPIEISASESRDPVRHAGAVSFRDAQGQPRAIQIVHPDSMGAIADQTSQETIEDHLARFIDAQSFQWIGAETGEGSSTNEPSARSTDAHRFALWMLWGAFLVGVIEFILARLFTQRLIASERAMGAEGRGARA